MRSTIFASVALSTLTTTIVLPILTPLIRALNLSESQGGWMISIGSLAMAVTAAAWGAASDRFGRKSVILAGFAGLFASQLLYTTVIWSGLSAMVAGSALFLLLVLGRALIGAFLPAVPAGAQALMADNTTASDRSAGMAIIGAASGVGLVVGPALGGVLALQGLLWPLVLATLLCLLACVAAFILLPQAPPRPRERTVAVNPLAPALLPWLLAGVLTMGAIVTMQISGGFYFQDRLGLSTNQTGPLLSIALTLVGVALFVTQVLQVRILRWAAGRMILAGAALWVAGLLVLLFTATLASYFLAYALMGAGAGMLMPGYMAGASLAVPAERQGAVAGLSAAAQGIGFTLAPAASTMLYEIDKALPLWCLVGLMALLFVLFAARTPEARPGESGAQ